MVTAVPLALSVVESEKRVNGVPEPVPVTVAMSTGKAALALSRTYTRIRRSSAMAAEVTSGRAVVVVAWVVLEVHATGLADEPWVASVVLVERLMTSK